MYEHTSNLALHLILIGIGIPVIILCDSGMSIQGKPTAMSSDGQGASARAVDGNTNTAFTSDSCTHSDSESNPWWKVDLQTAPAVTSVTVWNRGVSVNLIVL